MARVFITGAAAFVRNDRLDILAANELEYARYSEVFTVSVRPPTGAGFVFLDRPPPVTAREPPNRGRTSPRPKRLVH